MWLMPFINEQLAASQEAADRQRWSADNLPRMSRFMFDPEAVMARLRDRIVGQAQVLDSIDLIFEEGNPSGIKCLLNILEISSDSVRLPLVPASEDLRQKMIKFVATLKK